LGDGHLEAAPMVKVLNATGQDWASSWVALGAVIAMTSVLPAVFVGLTQLTVRTSSDGYLPQRFSKLHPVYGTPVTAVMFWAPVSAAVAGFLSIKELVTLVNIGTLFAFLVVCLSVIVLRHTEPEHPRPFKCWGYPVVPLIGAAASLALMLRLPWMTWVRFLGWMAIGLVIYFGYSSRRNRQVEAERAVLR